MTNINRDKASAVTFAFNATGMTAADSGSQKPWRRAALRQMAEREFERLGNLRPARAMTHD